VSFNVPSAHTKHINFTYHFIHEKVASSEAALTYVHTKENLVDILTKGLDVQQHKYLMGKLGMEKEGDFSLRGSVSNTATPAKAPGESAVELVHIHPAVRE
jgi:hypothetical protein